MVFTASDLPKVTPVHGIYGGGICGLTEMALFTASPDSYRGHPHPTVPDNYRAMVGLTGDSDMSYEWISINYL